MLFDVSNVINWVILLVGLISLLYLYLCYKQSYWSRHGVYSPPAHWFFGHLRDAILLRSAPPTVLGELHKSCPNQPVVGFYILQKPFLLIRSADVIKQILVKDFHNFSNRYVASQRKGDVIGSANLFSIDNPTWKYLRQKLSPGFTSGKQKQLFALMLESAENLKKHLATKFEDSDKQTIEVKEISTKYIIDIIMSLSFGVSTNSFDNPKLYKRSRRIVDQNVIRTLEIFLNFFFPKLNDLFGGTFFGDAADYLREIFWESMKERERSGIKRGDILDLLLELKNEKQSSEFKFEGDYLVAQSAVFFVAGTESSSVIISFTLLELAKNPEIQRKLRAELREMRLKNKTFTYESISEMNYLQQVVSEVLRFYPPAPLIDRVAGDDYKVPETDIVIKKGTGIYIALKGLHVDPEYFVDPLKFDPDRFSESRKQDIKPCTYLPFGDGPRMCIGFRIAKLQAMVGLITILSEYEVSLNSNYENEISKRSIFTAPASGVHLIFKKNPVIS